MSLRASHDFEQIICIKWIRASEIASEKCDGLFQVANGVNEDNLKLVSRFYSKGRWSKPLGCVPALPPVIFLFMYG